MKVKGRALKNAANHDKTYKALEKPCLHAGIPLCRGVQKMQEESRQFYHYWHVRETQRRGLTLSEQMMRFWRHIFKFFLPLTLPPLLAGSTVALPEFGCTWLPPPAPLTPAAAEGILLHRTRGESTCSTGLSKWRCQELGFPSLPYFHHAVQRRLLSNQWGGFCRLEFYLVRGNWQGNTWFPNL